MDIKFDEMQNDQQTPINGDEGQVQEPTTEEAPVEVPEASETETPSEEIPEEETPAM